jgi:hypothetical protein
MGVAYAGTARGPAENKGVQKRVETHTRCWSLYLAYVLEKPRDPCQRSGARTASCASRSCSAPRPRSMRDEAKRCVCVPGGHVPMTNGQCGVERVGAGTETHRQRDSQCHAKQKMCRESEKSKKEQKRYRWCLGVLSRLVPRHPPIRTDDLPTRLLYPTPYRSYFFFVVCCFFSSSARLTLCAFCAGRRENY